MNDLERVLVGRLEIMTKAFESLLSDMQDGAFSVSQDTLNSWQKLVTDQKHLVTSLQEEE